MPVKQNSCSSCSLPLPLKALATVQVAARRGDERRTLTLCHRCAHNPGATWRLRWTEVKPS
jgi:RNase P subunit RPR2